MKKSFGYKITAFILCIAIILPTFALIPFKAFASNGSDADSVYSEGSSSESVYLNGVYYHIDKKVSYVGNNSYQLNIQLKTSLSETNTPLYRTAAKNGYFTVEKEGYYLLELWGGAGSNGGDIQYILSTHSGGSGGDAGYVYAKVYLEAGQTLAYSIGTNGMSTTYVQSGGGVNGDGGEKGEVGSYQVGGGGGYSALYFFESGEFNPAWLTADGEWNMPESARLSRYVMIAAGGGGGGAANGLIYSSHQTANGGAGGNVMNGVSMTLSGNSYAVEGYIFAGRNGTSSGSSTTYTGRGGTNVPGAIVSTNGGQYSATPGPNDWSGAYNIDNYGGAGGSGNLRGGGGGAGYCGGSGGVMEALLRACNIGGGGGGSSFIASRLSDSALVFGDSLDAATATLLAGPDRCPSNVGGAFSYTYLGEDADTPIVDTSYLNSVTFEGTLSQYFKAVSHSSVDAAGNPNGNISYDETTGAFTVTGANIGAGNAVAEGTLLSVHFSIRPKEEFAGGNNVPLLSAVKATVVQSGTQHIVSSKESAESDYVNVPLSFHISTNSEMISLKDGDAAPTFSVSGLYNPAYEKVIEAFGKGNAVTWEYSFIENIENYKVYEGKTGSSGTLVTYTTTPEISSTTYYSVVLSVTPKTASGYAKVGPKCTDKEFTGIACIAIVGSDTFTEGLEYTVSANKTLTHDGTDYLFTTDVNQAVEATYKPTESFAYTSGITSDVYAVPVSGYYLVQLWGADGGNGGIAQATNTRAGLFGTTTKTSTANYSSSTGLEIQNGGLGGYIYGFVYLEAGDFLNLTLGSRGGKGGDQRITTAGSDAIAEAFGGGGGAYTQVSLKRGDTESVLMIAGGGGGGGGGAAGVSDLGAYTPSANGQYAYQRTSVTYGTSVSSDISVYRGGGGTRGVVTRGALGSLSAGSAAAGTPGINFANSNYVNLGKSDGETVYIGRLADTMLESGAVSQTATTKDSYAQVTYICTPDTRDELNSLPHIQTTGTFSRYFDIVEKDGMPAIEMVIKGMEPTRKTVETVDGVTTITYYENELMLASFAYTITANADGTTAYDIKNTLYYPSFEISETAENGYIANSGFNLVFRLQPKDGFLGGNDIPVLLETEGESSCVSVSQDGNIGYLSKDDAVDYANVAINYDLAADLLIKDQTVILGDADTSNDSVTTDQLYELTTDLAPAEESEAWKSQYVYLVRPATEVIAPTVTTTHDITVSILPKTAVPEKALIIGASDGLSETLGAIIYVRYAVTYNMTNMVYEGEATALYNTDFTTKVLAAEGYLQPPLTKDGKTYIKVKVGGSEITDFTYDEATGQITVPAAMVTAPIEIIAEGKERDYTIHFVYSLDGSEQIEHTATYTPGATIDYTWFNSLVIPERTGYEMLWEWDTDDAAQPTVMPARDVWAVGSYEKIRYTLTVNYVDSTGAALCEPSVTLVPFEEEYTVSSPVIDGYMPSTATANGTALSDPFMISGTMDAGNVTVTVTYLSAANRLVILYLSPDDRELAPRVDLTLTENATYSHTSPAVTGYTVDPAYTVISGTMVGTESVMVKVYYTPNRYKVDLEYRYEGMEYPGPRPEGVDVDYIFTDAYLDGDDSITVEYDNIFSYNAATGSYGLPMPIVLGYTFAGWYTDTTYTTEVTEDTAVDITSDITIYAKWEPMAYRLTLKYEFVFEEGDFAPDYTKLTEGVVAKDNYFYLQVDYYLGQSYNIPVGSITGYTAYTDYGLATAAPVGNSITGTMPASNIMLYVTYEINTYTIRFLDVAGSNITYPDDPGENAAAFDTQWLTLRLKHGVTPVYTEAIPTHAYDSSAPEAVYEFYTYTFTHWIVAGTENTFAPADTLSLAVADTDYCACYTATENVAFLVDSNSLVLGYYDTVQEAVDAGVELKTNSSDAPTVKLRRNGAADTVDLTRTEVTPTLNVGNSNSNYLYFDLNGYRLTSNTTVLNNSMYLYLIDSVGTGEIYVEAEDDVTALTSSAYNINLGTSSSSNPRGIRISVVSRGGDAIGVRISSSNCIYLYSGSSISAVSDGGKAYGIYHSYSTSSNYVIVYGDISAESDSGAAYGIYSACSVSLYYPAVITATSESSEAYGIYSAKDVDVNSTGPVVSASSTGGNAYGLYIGNAFYTNGTSDTTPTTITATSQQKDAYGVYANRLDTYMYANVTARAENGLAVGIQSKATRINTIGAAGIAYTVHAIGKNAIAMEYNYEGDFYINLIAEGTESAIGLKSNGATISIYDGTNIRAVSEAGVAYAVYDVVLKFPNTASVGSISAETQSGNAYALYNTTLNSYSTETPISATATTGNAYGFAATLAQSRNTVANSVISATATSGTAYGAFVSGRADLLGSLSAEGNTAYGIFVAIGGSINTATSLTVTAVGSTISYGIYNCAKATLAGGTVSSTSQGEAYGIANMGGTLANVATDLYVTATSTGANSYALYNKGGDTGENNLSGALSMGVFTANAEAEGAFGYALYAADGAIYIRGSKLYYKGSADDTARYGNVVIIPGYTEAQLAADDVTYPSYYYLTPIEYTITFVQTDLDGNVVLQYAPITYNADMISISAPVHPTSDYLGYTGAWEAYDFSAPAEGMNKFVYSVYTRNTYTISFYTNNDGGTVINVQYRYLDPISPITNVGTKYGYVFSNVWKDAAGNVYTFTTMPYNDISLYAEWVIGTFTITFVTNTSTSIPPITGRYGDPFNVTLPTNPGYTFSGWYEDEAFTTRYSSTTIPGKNMTLYAKWTASQSIIVLGTPIACTVNLNLPIDTDGDGVNDSFPIEMQAGTLTPIDVSEYWWLSLLPEELSSLLGDGKTYFLRGWADSTGKLVNLASGVDSWGVTPVNGVIDLYPVFGELENAVDSYDIIADFNYNILNSKEYVLDGHSYDYVSMNQKLNDIATDIGGVMLANTYTQQTGYLYLTYRALFSGTQTVTFLPAMYAVVRNTYINMTVYGIDGSERTLEQVVLTPGVTYDSHASCPSVDVDMNVGDVLVISMYDDVAAEDADDGHIILTVIDSPISASDYMELVGAMFMHNAMDFFFYTPDMGNITLPTNSTAGYEGITGWMMKENGSYSAPFNVMTTDIFNHIDAWLSFEGMPLLILYPDRDGEMPSGNWLGTVTAGRHFELNAFSDDLKTQINIPENGAVTFIFGDYEALNSGAVAAGSLAVLNFAQGLPVGATVSLVNINLEENRSEYYYYIVTVSGTSSIPLNQFVKNGGTEKFSGFGSIMMFNISYANTTHALTSETVSLTVDGVGTNVALTYNFLTPNIIDLGHITLGSDQELRGDVSIPSMDDQGFSATDKGAILVHLEDKDGNIVSFPSGIEITAVNGAVYLFDQFAIADWGMSMEMISAAISAYGSISATGIIDLSALRYHGFDGVVVYDLFVVPDGIDISKGSFISSETYLHTEYRLELTVADAPDITLDKYSAEVAPGGSSSVEVTVDGLSSAEFNLFVYQLEDGILTTTADCQSLFRGVTISNIGQVTLTSGTLTSGNVTFYVSPDAKAGVYFLVAYYGEQYTLFTLTVTAE